jgi:hypothetical protein
MSENYYRILGVNSSTSAEGIKKAYRAKAREMHPDVNRSENAHEQFLLLREAYEYLLNHRNGKTRRAPVYATDVSAEHEREQARERAREYARMKYEEYIKTDDFRIESSMDVIADHVQFGFTVLIFSAVLVLIITNGWTGVMASGMVLFFTFPIIIDCFYKFSQKIGWRKFTTAVKNLFRGGSFKE